MATRVSIEDLAGAADWLRAYEADDGPIGDNGPADDERAIELLRVADWVDSEIARRQLDAAARTTAKQAGVTVAVARRALVTRLAEAEIAAGNPLRRIPKDEVCCCVDATCPSCGYPERVTPLPDRPEFMALFGCRHCDYVSSERNR